MATHIQPAHDETVNTDSAALTIRGKRIGEDENGWVCLDDIWSAARGTGMQAPKYWRRQKATERLIETLQKKVTADHLNAKKLVIPVVYAGRGRGAKGTFAHPVL